MNTKNIETYIKVPVETLFDLAKKSSEKVKKNKYKEFSDIYSSKPYAKFTDLGADERVTREYYSELNYVKCITDWNNYYMFSDNVRFTLKENPDIEELFKKVLKRINFEDLVKNYAGLDASKYGTGFLYFYTDNLGRPGLTWLSPTNTYVKYNNTTREPIYAIRWWEEEDIRNPNIKKQFLEYTDEFQIILFSKNRNGVMEVVESRTHPFETIPIIEYMHNKERDGEIAGQLKANQLINMLLSKYNEKLGRVSAETMVMDNIAFDSVDAKDLFTKKGLLFTKNSFDEAGRESTGSVSYIQNTIPQGFIEAVEFIRDAMFDTSCTPNFFKESFYGDTSGVALKLKLTPTENKIKSRIELFKTATYKLLECIRNYLIASDYKEELKELKELDVRDFEIEFKTLDYSGVVDKMEMLNFMKNSQIFSMETILSEAGIDNPKGEIERKIEEDNNGYNAYSKSELDMDLNEINTSAD